MIAYFDCFSGISGDMTLGALVDLGVPPQWLSEHLKKALGITGFEIETRTVERGGLRGVKVDVQISDTSERDYARIRQLIEDSALSEAAAANSLRMFRKIAEAEAFIHGCPVDEVHFHELGGVDAIVDIVGTAVSIEYLGIDTVVSSRIPLGSGMVDCSHGRLPVPAPATLAMLSGIPVYGTDIGFELVTPTGAAIISSLSQSFEPVPDMVVKAAGYGAGSRDFPAQPNLLRIVTGEHAGRAAETIEVIETAIDDMNPEVFGYLSDRLFDAGARDVCLIPVYMKKGRPGTLLQVLCTRSTMPAISQMILTETSSAGLRHHTAGRQVLERKRVVVPTPYGRILAKRLTVPDGGFRIAPEFDDCRRVAEAMAIPLRKVYEAVIKYSDDYIIEEHGENQNQKRSDT
jgi:pyridinium-3,5-bisthiocarboxylic acid mononucleotide nickel chelatase